MYWLPETGQFYEKFGGVLLILRGLQLLQIYKPPIRSISNFFKVPTSSTVTGAFLPGLSFRSHHRWGRGAPMLLIFLTSIALYQTAFQGFFTMLIYAVGLSIPLIVISSLGGALGKQIKDKTRVSGEVFDKINGVVMVLIGIVFLYLVFH